MSSADHRALGVCSLILAGILASSGAWNASSWVEQGIFAAVTTLVLVALWTYPPAPRPADAATQEVDPDLQRR